MQRCLFLHGLHALILSLQILITDASPAALAAQPLLPVLNGSTTVVHLPVMLEEQFSSSHSGGGINAVDLHCFSPAVDPERRPIDAEDCNKALRVLIRQPNFLVPYRFSKNKRRLDVIRVPRGWESGECIIFISCENELDTDVFRLADVARQARGIIQACIDGKPTSYGGIDGIGSAGSFYVAIGRSTHARDLVALETRVGLGSVDNATLLRAEALID